MTELKRIFVKGGIISPNELKQIIDYAESLGLEYIHFGSRQDIILPPHKENAEVETGYPDIYTETISNPAYQNISCSYVSADIFPSTHWLNGSTYLYILESFKYQPKLKVNICDPKQKLTPIFSGQLNYIASDHEDYWYLHLNLPNWTETSYYPVLVYSWDLAELSQKIEELMDLAHDTEELFLLVNEQMESNNRTFDRGLEIPYTPFPYYEGMNKMGIRQYWLGLYWRNNNYYLSFLRRFCDFCLENKVGKICITAWKSFIVKGIPKESKLHLEKLLGEMGINVRHSLLELNWHLPVHDEDALELKKFIVRSFDQNDISTYGLTFGISNKSDGKTYFTSIVVEKNPIPELVKQFKVRPTYNVLHSENFDPNEQDYHVYAQDVDKIELPGLLMELSKMYFEQLGSTQAKNDAPEEDEEKREIRAQQCQSCLTIYDAAYGDHTAKIAPGTDFDDLPADYCCPVCEASKTEFKEVLLLH